MRWHLKLIHQTYVAWDGTWLSKWAAQTQTHVTKNNKTHNPPRTPAALLSSINLIVDINKRKLCFLKLIFFFPKNICCHFTFWMSFGGKLMQKTYKIINVLKLYRSWSPVEKDKNLAFKKTRVLLFHILDPQLPEILPLHISRLVSETKLGRRCATGKTWTTAKQISRQLQCWS